MHRYGVNALSACALSCAYVLFLVKHLCVLANKETVDTVVAGFLFIIGMNAAACHNNDICALFNKKVVIYQIINSAVSYTGRDINSLMLCLGADKNVDSWVIGL